MNRIILAPQFDRSDVIRFTESFRNNGSTQCRFIYSDLEGKKPRKEHGKLAQEKKAKFIDIEGGPDEKSLIEQANKIFGEGMFCHRLADDEDLDECYPNKQAVQKLYGTDKLDWLIDNMFDDDLYWNVESFYVFPGNPENTSCTIPINARLLIPAKPGKPRACPRCGKVYISKFPRSQCRDVDCRYGYIPHTSTKSAYEIIKVPAGKFGFGHCPRCNIHLNFTNLIEQCTKCGQLAEGVICDGGNALKNNKEQVMKFLDEIKQLYGKKWWQLWK